MLDKFVLTLRGRGAGELNIEAVFDLSKNQWGVAGGERRRRESGGAAGAERVEAD